ncbi:MAG TPA: peptidylprolyl isomerase [Candidatus Paceibacterota bacterium]
MRNLVIAAVIIIAGLALWRYYGGESAEPTANSNNKIVTIHTTKGDIKLELFADKTPITVKNFTDLAGKGFYNDTLFHRVIPGFMIQGGDPNTRAGQPNTYGMGGPGYAIPDEFVPGLSNVRGTISMANAGPNTGGSQFFINVADNTFLDGKHTVFGKVLEGMGAVDQIVSVPRNERDVPLDPVRIDSIDVE